MARGLDELIDWLVTETAYRGESGFCITEFVAAVSRFYHGTEHPRGAHHTGHGSAPSGSFALDDMPVDMPLARKAWEWLLERPEIFVGRDGSCGHLSLDDALALPELSNVASDEEEQKINIASTALSLASLSPSMTITHPPRRRAARKISKASLPDVPGTQPRLYATERTIWYTLTGHDVDHKRVPPLEWQCLMGIATAREEGILQGDLRALVGQDKRSVPKRTDFLAAKGYVVKRTAIARGFRTSMLWLTEFAPAELADADNPTTAAIALADPSQPPSLTLTEPAVTDIDLSPEFLKKNLDPVPWRNRWIGSSIEFASFGQTILAICRTWGVIRVVDLKTKLGIVGMRWQMRTLARVCREFVASGVLRFVAAMIQDERKLFKDCIKYERDPTPSEWAIYLAAGRRRTPMARMYAKYRREQERSQGDDDADEDEDDYDDGDDDTLERMANDASLPVVKPTWILGVPLLHLVFDTVRKAGVRGITSPEISQATVGTTYSRYVFTLVHTLARPNNQPQHLARFQLHCEPSRVGKNNAYLFRTLDNYKMAERLCVNGDASTEDIETAERILEQEAQEKASLSTSDAAVADEAQCLRELVASGDLSRLSNADVVRCFGNFPPELPTRVSTDEAYKRLDDIITQRQRGHYGWRRSKPLPTKGKRGRPRWAPELTDATGEGTPPKRKRGRPRKSEVVLNDAPPTHPAGSLEDDIEVALDDQDSYETRDFVDIEAGQDARKTPGIQDTQICRDDQYVDAQKIENVKGAETLPMIRIGKPNYLNRQSKAAGRPKQSTVLIFRHEKLRNSNFLTDRRGYKEGTVRAKTCDNSDGGYDGLGKMPEVADQNGGNADRHSGPDVMSITMTPTPAIMKKELHMAELVPPPPPVASCYNGQHGHLVLDKEHKAVEFTFSAPRRRGRPPTRAPKELIRESIIITVASLVNDPVIRNAPGGDGPAMVFEVREDDGSGNSGKESGHPQQSQQQQPENVTPAANGGAPWPFVFILDEEAENNDEYAASLRDAIIAIRTTATENSTPPVKRRGRPKGMVKRQFGVGPSKFQCDKCLKTWKNLLGLQYHQTKAQTACNPSYTPLSPSELLARKRKRAKPIVPDKDDGITTGAEAGGRRLRERKRRPLMIVSRDTSPTYESIASPASTRSTSISASTSSSPELKNISRRRPQKTATQGDAHQPDSAARRLRIFDITHTDVSHSFRGITGAANVGTASQGRDRSPIFLPAEDADMEYVDRADVTGEACMVDQTSLPPISSFEDDPQSSGASFDRANGGSTDSLPITPATLSLVSPIAPSRTISADLAPKRDNFSMKFTQSLLENKAKNAAPTSSTAPVPIDPANTPTFPIAEFRMPSLPKNISKLTHSVTRSIRVMEIIKYLVDRFGGVFPSDRSMWYASFAVYTRTFPGDEPPSMSVNKASIKKLKLSKEIEEHTFGFRDARGQFIYCRLLARPGTDLATSTSARQFKQSVQAAYPQPYIPEDALPTEGDLAVLRVLDKDSANSTPRHMRGRRSLAPEIEVLTAPVYEMHQTPRSSVNTVLIVDPGDEDEDVGNGEERLADGSPSMDRRGDSSVGGSGLPEIAPKVRGRKRKEAPAVEHYADTSAVSSTKSTPMQKRARFADFIAGKSANRWSRRSGAADDDESDEYDIDSLDTGGIGHPDAIDDEAFIDPQLRTVKATSRTQADRRNPGLDSLPASFFLPGTCTGPRSISGTRPRGNKAKPTYQRKDGDDGYTIFLEFLPPNTRLWEATDDKTGPVDDHEQANESLVLPRPPPLPSSRARPRAYKLVTKTLVLYDSGPQSGGQWPPLTEMALERHSDSSVAMDGFMPSRKALVRQNLPRSIAECAQLLRGNQKRPASDGTAMGDFLCDVELCRNWELSQKGTDVLRNPSVSPVYVFLNVPFPGIHYTVEAAETAKTGIMELPAPAIGWLPKNQYTVDTIPYGALDEDDRAPGGPGSSAMVMTSTGASELVSVTTIAVTANSASPRRKSAADAKLFRERRARQAKYVTSSRREMTAYPQTPDDYMQLNANLSRTTEATLATTNPNDQATKINWKADETHLAAFVAVRTLLGGLGQSMDWGLLMRLFTDERLTTLRTFWRVAQRERQAYIDELTERFQEAFLKAYEVQEVPALDYNNILAYDWRGLVSWTLRFMRHNGVVALPTTQAQLTEGYDIVDALAAARNTGWREDYFHISRSVWNRLQESAGEAAALPLGRSGIAGVGTNSGSYSSVEAPLTPAEAAAAQMPARLRIMVARSWIRALCGTPHERYEPARIKSKLLTLGRIGPDISDGDGDGGLDEKSTNKLLQAVIGELTNDRVLRRSKSMIAVGGRMYQLSEMYESTLEKMAMEDKFQQAWAFKLALDACFRAGGDGINQAKPGYNIPLDTNDDGMIMAVLNLQAHGRVTVESIDPPHVPFGFEPGNYETRKFPKHYQRFRQRIVPTDQYLYNDDAELAGQLDRVVTAVVSEGDGRIAPSSGTTTRAVPGAGEQQEIPIWRDFFGVLDMVSFARLAGAVVFLLATRGATSVKQTAAFLRPIVEPFEVEALVAWGKDAGILESLEIDSTGETMTTAATLQMINNPPGSGAVTEWWWLLVGKLYEAKWAEQVALTQAC